ncbi:MAG: hypothetical protein WBO23_10555 [Burkholderiales bacterium]
MKPHTDLSFSELYAVERAARTARAQEAARLILAGTSALGRFARRAAARLAAAAPVDSKEISHA